MAENATSNNVVGAAQTEKGNQATTEVQVPADSIEFTIQKNKYGDELPIIPKDAIVRGGRILYQLTVKYTVKLASGAPAVNRKVSFKSSIAEDKIEVSGPTNNEGEANLILKSWEQGKRKIKPEGNYQEKALEIEFKDAWYEEGFEITAYHFCDESDFSGELVSANGLSSKHKQDFLFGAKGVAMQGTGKALNGQYVRYRSGQPKWNKNKKGNPTDASNPDDITFFYSTTPGGKATPVQANKSIAVDPKVIPMSASVFISSANGKRVLGNKSADDVGSKIKGFHIDNFVGLGKSVVTAWEKDGGNIDNAKVKYLAK